MFIGQIIPTVSTVSGRRECRHGNFAGGAFFSLAPIGGWRANSRTVSRYARGICNYPIGLPNAEIWEKIVVPLA